MAWHDLVVLRTKGRASRLAAAIEIFPRGVCLVLCARYSRSPVHDRRAWRDVDLLRETWMDSGHGPSDSAPEFSGGQSTLRKCAFLRTIVCCSAFSQYSRS